MPPIEAPEAEDDTGYVRPMLGREVRKCGAVGVGRKLLNLGAFETRVRQIDRSVEYGDADS